MTDQVSHERSTVRRQYKAPALSQFGPMRIVTQNGTREGQENAGEVGSFML